MAKNPPSEGVSSCSWLASTLRACRLVSLPTSSGKQVSWLPETDRRRSPVSRPKWGGGKHCTGNQEQGLCCAHGGPGQMQWQPQKAAGQGSQALQRQLQACVHDWATEGIGGLAGISLGSVLAGAPTAGIRAAARPHHHVKLQRGAF